MQWLGTNTETVSSDQVLAQEHPAVVWHQNITVSSNRKETVSSDMVLEQTLQAMAR